MRVFCGQLIILDTAHNPAAARALLSQLNWHLGRSRRGASPLSPSFDLVFGSLVDKDYAATFALLASQSAGGLILTFSHEQSLTAADASQLAAAAPSGVEFELGNVSGLRAWIMRRRATGRLHRPLVVTGSFALIGQVMEELRFDPL